MAGIADLIGQFVTPQSASPAASMASSSTPVDYKQFLAPILEAVATEARRKADPIQRLYDVGGAIFDSASTGSPFSRNLAALDESRNKAISGAGNMFLNVLGMERQLEELKGQDRRHQESMALQQRRLDQDERQFKTTSGLSERRLDATERRETRVDAQARRTEERGLYQKNVDMAVGTLPDEQKKELADLLAKDKDYQNMVDSGLYADAGRRLREHYLKLAPKQTKEVSQATEGLGTLNSSMARMRELFKESDWTDRMAGPETRRRFQTVHAQALNAVRALGEMGVLTPGEVPFAERFMPSPTAWSVYGKESILAGFDELDRYIAEKITRFAAKTGMSEDQIRKLSGMGPKTGTSRNPLGAMNEGKAPEIERRGPGYEIQKPALRFNPSTGRIERNQ